MIVLLEHAASDVYQSGKVCDCFVVVWAMSLEDHEDDAS